MDEIRSHPARLGGRITEQVEVIKKFLDENPGKTCGVFCMDAKKARKTYEGRGLDLSRVEFIEPPEEQEKPSRAAPVNWITKMKSAAFDAAFITIKSGNLQGDALESGPLPDSLEAMRYALIATAPAPSESAPPSTADPRPTSSAEPR